MSSRRSLGLVRSELTKILSTRLWWGLLAGVVIYTVIQSTVSAAFAGMDSGVGGGPSPGLDTAVALRGVYAGAAFTGAYIFALVIGVTGMTAEYRYETATPTFLATPRRVRVVVAKSVAHLGVGLAYGLVAVVCALVAGGAVVLIRGHSLGLDNGSLWRAIALAVLAVSVWTLVGLGIGTLIRNQVAALLVAVAVTFLVEPLVSIGLYAADLDAIGKFLPSTASAAMTSPPATYGDLLPWWAGALVLCAYALVFAALGVWLSVRRDIT
jgi:ABC-type transport system involved in multi-copper enzyme maturation permease subunit